MPQLFTPPTNQNIKKFYLPSTSVDDEGKEVPKENQGWVMLDIGPNMVGDLEAFSDLDPNRVVRGLKALLSRIKDWNICEYGTDQVADITFDTVARMNPVDQRYLLTLKTEQGEPPLTPEKKSS
jgi:hypothetical protein